VASKSTALPDAPSPDRLPPGTVAAPPGTKEGDTCVLSVTDRRLAEMQESSKSVSPERKTPTAASDLGGWRAVGPRQAPMETATQAHETDR
jgi:hypothetical protein